MHRDKRVLDASPSVRAHGVRVGMPLAEAKAVARDARCVAWEEEPYRAAQAAWLDVCAEFSDAIEPERQHAAWVDLSGHPDASEIAVMLAEAVEARLGYAVRIGLAGTKWIAEVAARAAHPDLPGLASACGGPAAFLAPLGVEWLLPVMPVHRERLRYLGYRTIGGVAGVPYRTLETQFAVEGRRILDAAHGRCFEPVRAVYPPDTLLERFAFEGATEDLMVFDAGLQFLAARISKRLGEQDRCGAELRVWIERESGEVEEVARRFVHPLRTPMSLLAGLRAVCAESLRAPRPACGERVWGEGPSSLGDMSHTRHAPAGFQTPSPQPLSQQAGRGARRDVPITALRVRLPGLVRAKRLQQQLPSAGASVPSAHAQEALSKVRAVFGDSSVLRGDEVRVARRVAVLKAWRDALGWS